MVLSKLPVSGRPTNLDSSRARAYCACSRCGWGLFGHFFFLYHFSFLSLTNYKEANVCPIYKKGERSIASNYRPISILNSKSKLFERLVFKYLYNHLRHNDLLTALQSGFISGGSTMNQLTCLYDTFCQALDSGKEARAFL